MVFAWSFILGGIVMLVVERFRPLPVIRQAEHTSFARALGVGPVPDAGADSGRVTQRKRRSSAGC
jgi:hypothetical protein